LRFQRCTRINNPRRQIAIVVKHGTQHLSAVSIADAIPVQRIPHQLANEVLGKGVQRIAWASERAQRRTGKARQAAQGDSLVGRDFLPGKACVNIACKRAADFAGKSLGDALGEAVAEPAADELP
jgi:hypothetical protein